MEELIGGSLIIIAIGLYVVLARKSRDIVHPLALFLGAWIGVFGFAHFNVPRTVDEPYYADPFGMRTYAVVLAIALAFAIGFALVRSRTVPLDRADLAARIRASFTRDRLVVLTLVLYAIAVATTWYFVLVAGEIPLFSPRIDELRQTFKLPLLGYLYNFHVPVTLFAVMLATSSRSRWAAVSWWVIAGTALFFLMFGGVRVSALMALFWVGVYLFYRQPRVSRRQVLVLAVTGITVFAVVEGYRRSVFLTNPGMDNPRVDRSPAATAWGHTAASFKNLQVTLTRIVSPLDMGTTSYDLPGTIVPSLRDTEDRLGALYGIHNMPTFAGLLYLDFGLFGLLVMPGLYGAIVAFSYGKFRRKANLFWLIVHTEMLVAVVIAFRTHRFFGNGFISFAVVAFAAQMLAGRLAAAEKDYGPNEPARTLGSNTLSMILRA